MQKVQIFITHYVNNDAIELNDILVEEILHLDYITKKSKIPYDITVIYYDENNAASELYDRLPKEVKIVRNDRPGRSDIQSSMRNKVVDLAEDHFVLLHNDVRVTIGWLDNIASEMNSSEEHYGHGNVVISPRYIPYWYIGSDGEISENGNFRAKYPYLWDRFGTLGIDTMRSWCKEWKFKFDGINVHSPHNSPCVTDDGHQLMMFMGTKKFFQDIGECDENFVGRNYDDQDWGIRALLAGKKNLKSQTCLIGHIEGLTFFHKNIFNKICINDVTFINKWGRPMFDEMQTGKLWIRLHKEQTK